MNARAMARAKIGGRMISREEAARACAARREADEKEMKWVLRMGAAALAMACVAFAMNAMSQFILMAHMCL